MILPGLLESRASTTSYGHPSNMVEVFGSTDTFAGVNVTPYNALQLASIYAAVRVLSEGMAVLSVDLFKRRAGGPGKDRERDHAASWVMREDANPETSAFIFRETLQGHLCTWGNAYAEIEQTRGAEVVGLHQRRPDRVEPDRDTTGGPLYYRVTRYQGGEDRVPAARMLHVPGLSFNGLKGFSPIEMLRDTIGRGMANGQYRSGFFGNRMQFGGIIKSPGKLGQPAKEAMLDALEKTHKGPPNAFRGMVLDEGMDWMSVGIPNDDAQMLETAVFDISEIARAFRVPLHLLAELTHATFTNIEHQDLEFVKYALLAWMRRWEGELNRKLLTQRERKLGLFFEFNADTLLRGDFETRMKGFQTAISTGMLSPNEARDKDNLNPYDGGDVYMAPLNFQTVAQLGKARPAAVTERTLPDGSREVRVEMEPEQEERESPPELRDLPPVSRRSVQARRRLREVFEGLLIEAAGRLVASEVRAIRKALASLPLTGQAAFRLWLEGFFEKHEAFARSVMGPLFLALQEAAAAEVIEEMGGDLADFRADLETFHREYTEAFGRRHAQGGLNQILALLRDEDGAEADVVAAVSERLAGWEESSPHKIGQSESNQAMNAVSVAAYAFAGVTILRWVWGGGDCKICPKMHGRTVEIGRPFVVKGDTVGPGDGTVTDFVVKKVRNHPPLHRGCKNCTVAPG